MSYTQIKFLGATVTGFNSSVAWNEQTQQVYIYLVEDQSAGDDFILKNENVQNIGGKLVGTPIQFSAGNFSFSGILQSWVQKNSFNGNPVFEVVLTSVMSLLEATTVILSAYVGPVNDSIFGGTIQLEGKTFQCSNLLNVYGYLESGGSNFGNAQENESGLLWEGSNGVKQSLMTLTSLNPASLLDQTNYGSYIKFRGHNYQLDLTGLPIAPGFYRLGGATHMTLIEIISSICQDGGVDYAVELKINAGTGPHIISFKTVNLTLPPTLGQISSFINSRTDINNANAGEELRNDITQAFLIGGDIQILQPMENFSSTNPAVMPFWGFDVNGNPIIGQKPDGTFFADDDHAMNLNATRIADIMGSLGLGLSYSTNILELRCALVNYDSWATYLQVYKQTFAQALGLYGAVKFDQSGFIQSLASDFVDDSLQAAKSLGEMNENQQWTTVSQRVYEFVRGQAEMYYGKQFLVQIPFPVKVKIIPETVATLYSHEPADAGFLPEGSSPLGLNYINENYFLDQTGRFLPFLRFAYNTNFKSVGTIQQNANDSTQPDFKIVSANPSILDTSMIIQPNSNPSYSAIYVQNYQVENGPILVNGLLSGGNKIFFMSPPYGGIAIPVMAISISTPVFTQAEDPLGGLDDIGAILNVSSDNLLQSVQFRSTSFPLKLHPAAIYPNGVAIAIKSNQYTYGPWGKFTQDGKINIEQDTTLVPWEYGGYSALNEAAVAKLSNIATGKQIQERGTVEIAGLPLVSLGETLVNGGPEVTKIDVNIGLQGITTNYIMESFVPRAGVFIRENADRLKRFGKAYQELRKAIRQLYIERNNVGQIINSYYNGFMNGTSYAVQQNTPHAVLGAHLIPTGSSYLPMVYNETFQESVANIRGDRDDFYRLSACMSMDGLLRPFSTAPLASGISSYRNVSTNILSTPIHTSGLTPWQTGNDFLWFSSGQTYTGLNNRRSAGDIHNTRALGLRGPAVMVGWGYDLQGKPVPNSAASGSDPLQNYSSTFQNQYLQNSWNWSAGPVDLRWDKWRSVWASPGMILCGSVSGTAISPGGQGQMTVMIGVNGQTLPDTLTITHFFSSNTLNPGTKVITGYNPLDNGWYILSADCS